MNSIKLLLLFSSLIIASYAQCSSFCQTCDIGSGLCTVCDYDHFLLNGECIDCTGPGQSQQWLPSRICNVCSPNCNICANANACAECLPSFVPDQFGQCQPDLGAICGSGCQSCISPTQCGVCNANLFNYNGQCSHCNKPGCTRVWWPTISCVGADCLDDVNCPSGQYFDSAQNQCVACNERCQTCTDGVSCSSCKSPFLLFENQCYSECSVGSFGNPQTLTCDPCDSSCLTCNGGTNQDCLSCPVGSSLEGSVCTVDVGSSACSQFIDVVSNQCVACDQPGEFQQWSTHQCYHCSPYCSQCLNPTQCATCEANYVLDQNLQCQLNVGTSCTSNCQACVSATECGVCVDQFFNVQGQCVDCNVQGCAKVWWPNPLCITNIVGWSCISGAPASKMSETQDSLNQNQEIQKSDCNENSKNQLALIISMVSIAGLLVLIVVLVIKKRNNELLQQRLKMFERVESKEEIHPKKQGNCPSIETQLSEQQVENV